MTPNVQGFADLLKPGPAELLWKWGGGGGGELTSDSKTCSLQYM